MNAKQKIIFIEQMKLMRTAAEREALERGDLFLLQSDPRFSILEELDILYLDAEEEDRPN